MQIESASYEGGVLKLVTTSREVLRWVYEFKPGEYEIRKARKRRSLDANAYAWVLIDKIAATLNIPKTEVYRHTILEIGGVSAPTVVRNEAVDTLCKAWAERGVGWQTEILDAGPIYTTINLVFGSSAYDSEQMSRLIDQLIQDAKALGIETLPPEKLEGMMQAWEEASARKHSP